MTLAILLVLVAAFGAGFIDALAGGGGLIQLPALFATFPQAPHTTRIRRVDEVQAARKPRLRWRPTAPE